MSKTEKAFLGLIRPISDPATLSLHGMCPVRLDDTVTATDTARHAHLRDTVEVAAKIVTIADLDRVRIQVEVDAYDSGRVALGAEVRITAEGFERAS